MLLQMLERRKETIKRAASLTKISFYPPQDGYISVQVWWQGDGTLIKRFKYDDYYATDVRGPKLKTTPCRISRQFIQEILQARGI